MIYADTDGNELARWLGYLPPEEFAPRFLTDVGVARFQMKETEKAILCFEEAIARFPKSDAAPEAVYWRGVSLFKRTKTTKPIYEANREIVEKYPDSIWAKKLSFVKKYADYDSVGKK